MSAESFKSVVEQARQQFNAGNLDGYLELYAPNATLHYLPPGMPPGVEGARLFYGAFLAGFPGAQLIIDDILVDGNKLAARFQVQVTHQGEFMGLPPTGKSATLTGITIMRFADDKVIERWSESDFAGLMAQLAVNPGPGNG